MLLSMVLAIALQAVVLGGEFTSAEADATVIGASTIEVSISLDGPSDTAVVLHALDPGSDQRTLAMLEVAPGRHTTTFETRPVDLVVVFEDLTAGVESNPTRLTDLGVPRELVGIVEPVDVAPSPEQQSSSLGWLALALGLASLSALAFWAMGGSSRSDDAGAEDGAASSRPDDAPDERPAPDR